VLSPTSSPRGKLLSQYVRVRVPRMDDVNIALFDYDRYNALYFFILNADEHIYLRYGGRDNVSQDSYLHLDSLELALKKGLDLHRNYQAGKIKAPAPPKPMLPKEIPLLLERTYDRGACVECHLIGDFQLQQREMEGTLDKVTEIFRSPDLKNIGVVLDVPMGLVVKETREAAQQAGLEAGDLITRINGAVVWTFGDLQYAYDKVVRTAKQIRLTVEREAKPVELTLALPLRWWYSDIRYKQLTIDPRTYFESRPLTELEKKENNLPVDGFASRVSQVDNFARVLKSHALKPGDIIFGVDGVQRDEYADTAEFFIRLRKKAGDTVTLDVVRDGKRFQMPLRTFQMSFRK
jgi:serine protease Do